MTTKQQKKDAFIAECTYHNAEACDMVYVTGCDEPEEAERHALGYFAVKANGKRIKQIAILAKGSDINQVVKPIFTKTY